MTVNITNAPAGATAEATTTREPGGGTRIDIALKRHIDDTAAALVDSAPSTHRWSVGTVDAAVVMRERREIQPS